MSKNQSESGWTIVSAAEIAERLQGTLHGDAERTISGVAPLDEAGATDLSWLASQKYARHLESSKAGAILVFEDVAPHPAKTLIRVKDPDLALCEVLEWIGPQPDDVSEGIHPTAVVDTSVDIGEGAAIAAHVVVGPYSFIGANSRLYPGVVLGSHVRVGADCVLHPNVVVRERTRIGNRVTIQANASIGADGFGYLQRNGKHVKIPQVGIVVIEDDVEIGSGTCIDRAKSGVTRIGRGTKIDNLVQIAHNNQIGEDCVIAALSGIAGSCRVGNHVMVGGQVAVSDHVALGEGSMIVSCSAIGTDVPAGMMMRGVPAEDARLERRLIVARKKLPQLLEQMRDLVGRIERLESSADNSTRS
ncbi:MAG: UDP-3-O-(3-hydroxymyristoyl)glucosamine N-acyltransferase [Phycisphaerae bacterium]